jgi:5-methyltetrahydrofolate--homocysteine methyltransferase
MGTMLMAEGLGGGIAPERWNVEEPEKLKAVHQRYYEAGSDVVLTNTFGANRLKLKRWNLGDEVSRLNVSGVQLARSICPQDRFVAGDVGPSGEMLAPMGSVTGEELEEVFAEQAEALVSGGVDFIIVETMFSLEEAVSALRGVLRAARCPVFALMTYDKNEKGFFTMMGETPHACAEALEREGASAIGANCTIGSTEMISLVGILKEATSLPLILQPNAGRPLVKDGKTVYEQTPEEFARDIRSMVDGGAGGVGGCCGTTPDFIAAVRGVLSDR